MCRTRTVKRGVELLMVGRGWLWQLACAGVTRSVPRAKFRGVCIGQGQLAATRHSPEGMCSCIEEGKTGVLCTLHTHWLREQEIHKIRTLRTEERRRHLHETGPHPSPIATDREARNTHSSKGTGPNALCLSIAVQPQPGLLIRGAHQGPQDKLMHTRIVLRV